MSQDEELELVQSGKLARLTRSHTEETLISREEDIINILVGLFRRDLLTDDFLRGSIGEIAALRWFREQLETKIRQGVMAAEAALGTDNAEETTD